MNRKSFVQQCMIQSFPELMAAGQEAPQMIERHIKGAERLWQRLSEAGYGSREEKELSPKESWYGSMPDDLRQQFDRFWRTYGVKRDREGAAKAWRQIPDMSDTLAETVIRAAEMAKADAEANQETNRKYPQGWLSGRRWEDYDTTQARTAPQNQARRELQDARAELNQLTELNRNGELDGQIEQLRERIRGLESGLSPDER